MNNVNNNINLGHILGMGLNGASESWKAGNYGTAALKSIPIIGGLVSAVLRPKGQSFFPTLFGKSTTTATELQNDPTAKKTDTVQNPILCPNAVETPTPVGVAATENESMVNRIETALADRDELSENKVKSLLTEAGAIQNPSEQLLEMIKELSSQIE